ncbi:glycosyltransferase family 2 protein [Halomonas sp. SpR1]|uniref:glycosyltransferase family 2 protein n=1 Tax=Halomonas sp. SpR1 TaxID=3050462 RepID=UPI0027E40D4F|nr:glycosyltransferase family 2 protein [Halomonas sp. SpR1]MDQ7731788.1 glycosyltransferase family 2 protein [Halomonas sp. SpR1]
MKLSVILSTYNSPEWLEKVLWGYSVQSYNNFELIIADDGSTSETRYLIDRMREETGLTIKHVWQEDNGFQKCRILNKAIIESTSEYLVFSDGDCIPRQDFLNVHAREALPGYYLSGGYHKLPMATSEAITKEDVLSERCFDLKWLKAHGLAFSYKNSKLTATYRQAKLFNMLTPTRCRFKGSNGSAWKKDVLNVNGFDETLAYGGEDREFGVRLVNSGIKPKHVRYNAIVIHLDHARGYVDPDIIASNKRHRINIDKDGTIRTAFGIDQHQQPNAAGAIR